MNTGTEPIDTSAPNVPADIVERIPAAALLIEGERVFCNHAVEVLTGYRPGDTPSLDLWFRTLFGADHERARDRFETDRMAGFPAVRRETILRKDGSRRVVEIVGFDGERVICILHDITDFMDAQELLKEHAERYNVVKSTSMDGFWVVDRHGKVVEVNDACCHMLGYSREELLTLSLQQIDATESAEETREHIRKIIENGYERFEVRHRRKDGTIIDVEVSTTFLSASDHFLAFIRDIGERKRTEEALRESEERFRLAMEATSDGVWDWNIATDTGYFSPSYYRMLGHEPGALPATVQTWLDHLHPEDRERAVRANMDCVEGKTQSFQAEFRMRTRDGKWRWILGRGSAVTRDAEGRALRLIGTHQDITDRKVAEEALRNRERLLRDAQRIGHLGTYDYDITVDRWESSPELDSIFGISASHPKDFRSWLALIHPGHRQRMETYFLSLLSEKHWFDMEYKIIRPSDGEERWLYGTGEFTFDDDGRPVRMIGTIQDITDRKQAEEAILQLNRDLDRRVMERTAQLEEAIREQESFSYSVSHDLRAPLRHINSYSGVLLEDYGDRIPGEALHYLERIGTASRRMGQLIDDLLELSRVGRIELRKQTVNLSKKAMTIAAMLQETEPDRSVEWVIAQGLTAKADTTLIRQVLLNLLGNALKYTARLPRARIEFGSTTVDGEQAFFVRDNGAGFDMAYENKLFRPFQRLHGGEFPGTGIGLATVQRIIQRHGGRVWAEGKVNQGATFYFTLPVPTPNIHTAS